MNMQSIPDQTAAPLSRVKHVSHLARQFGKVRSFALEALLHLALSSMARELSASTGHTLSQNIDAMNALLHVLRDGHEEDGLDKGMFQDILARDDVDGGVVSDAEHLLARLNDAQARIAKGEFPTGAEIESLFEIYTDMRVRTSGFLRQVEHLTAEWQAEDENANIMRVKFSSAVRELESISAAINMLAINASVEASRAGDQGAAFSVIAREMHRLSTQSSHALRTTREALSI